MPTVQVEREALLARLGQNPKTKQEYSDKEFADLCFEYGIELDSVTSEREIREKAKLDTDGNSVAKTPEAAVESKSDDADDKILYKIEIPANRYDLLCIEGIARALRVFLEKAQAPVYKVITPPNPIQLIQKGETKQIRPFVVGAILRNVTFTEPMYKSFIDLQDKLHQNIGRKRTLVAIGTHDLDTIQGPFTYEALPKKDISFRPLVLGKNPDPADDHVYNGEELFNFYNTKPGCHLKPYLYITENSPVQPVIYDSKRVVCSLPPIINGEHSKITLNTKNVFIECTGTDKTKLSVALNQMVTMFSEYCGNAYEIEAVQVVDATTGVKEIFPQLENYPITVNVDYVNSAIGINVTADDMVNYLKKMSMIAVKQGAHELLVQVPPTRSDVLHECDIMEDIAISYGFNNIKKTVPQCYTQGKFNQLNTLTDAIREQVAHCGFNEVLTWVLLSFNDNYRFMQPKDVKGEVMDIKAAIQSAQAGVQASNILTKEPPLIIHPSLAQPKPVTLANPKSLDFQLVRTTMLPGLLKCVANNHGQVNLPIRLFECGDIGYQVADVTDLSAYTGAKNERHLGAIYCGKEPGFEEMLDLLLRVMEVNGVRFAPFVAKHREQHAKETAKLEAQLKQLATVADKKTADLTTAKKKATEAKASAEKDGAGAKEKEKFVAAEKAAAIAGKDATVASEKAGAVAALLDEHMKSAWKVVNTYSLRKSSHPSYFQGTLVDGEMKGGRCADIILHRPDQPNVVLGQVGTLHPDVFGQFGIPSWCSAFDINIEYFL